jgi:hypothetical protein
MILYDEQTYWREKTQQADVDRETAEIKMFNALKGDVYADGNMYCALIGSDIQEGCAAFEKTRLQAILSCMNLFRFEVIK